MISCGVCCETVAKAVGCSCEFDACVACAKRYLLESHEDPHCMSCRRAWGREDLTKNFGPTFVSTTYKKHRENVLFERERAMLPATQTRLDNYRLEKRLKLSIVDKKKKIFEMRKSISALESEMHEETRVRSRLLLTKWESGGRQNDVVVAKRTDRVVGNCPVDNCAGFLTSYGYACGVCKTKACRACNVVLTDDHVCRDEDVATASMIRKETKPCPKCAVPIFRSSGCPQMFCTQCQCVFDWTTGVEQKNGVVHNPHYFEWLARNGRNPADPIRGRGECGGFGFLYGVLNASKSVATPEDYARLAYHTRKATHIAGHTLDHLFAPGEPIDHTELRLKFLDNQIKEPEFKIAVQRHEKRRMKEIELRQILETYVAVVRDLVSDIGTQTEDDFRPPVIDIFKISKNVRALTELKTYIEQQIATLGKSYGSKLDFDAL